MSDSPRGLARLSVVGLFWTSLSMGALAVAEIVALVVLARLLAPDVFGIYTAALIVIKFSGIFSGLGVAPAIVQRSSIEERHYRVGFTLSLLLSALVCGGVWAAAPLIADLMRLEGLAPVVRAASVVFLFQGISMVALASAQRALRFRWLAGIDACAFAAGFVVVGPAMAWFGFGIWSLIAALASQHFLRMVALLAGQPHPKRLMLQRQAARELLRYGGGHTLARTGNYLAGQADKLIVGRWLGAETLGVYGLASQLMTAPAMIVGQVLDRVLFPTMSLVQQERSRLARAYRSGVAACALLVLPASVVLAILAPELVQVALGPAWLDVVAPFQILALGMLFRTSYKFSDSVARATGAVYNRAWRQAAFALAVCAGSLIGQRWGVEGVALGVVAAIFGNFLLMAQLSLSGTGMSWGQLSMAHLPGVALAGVLGASAWFLTEHLRELGVWGPVLLLDVILVAAGEAVLLCWLLPALFLGRDGRSVIGILAKVAGGYLERRRAG